MRLQRRTEEEPCRGARRFHPPAETERASEAQAGSRTEEWRPCPRIWSSFTTTVTVFARTGVPAIIYCVGCVAQREGPASLGKDGKMKNGGWGGFLVPGLWEAKWRRRGGLIRHTTFLIPPILSRSPRSLRFCVVLCVSSFVTLSRSVCHVRYGGSPFVHSSFLIFHHPAVV